MTPAKIPSRILICTLFCVCGFLGNWFKITLFFNVDFIFGSIFSMLAIMMLGRGWGIFTAFLAGTCTYLIWNHPWAIIVFTGEAAFVSWLYAKRKGNLVLYDLVYWICLGMPMICFFYYQVMGVAFESTLIIMLKQAINGIFNTLLAIIAFTHFNFLMRRQTIRTAYSELLFAAMVTSAMFPIILLSVFAIRTHQENRMNTLRSQVTWVAEAAQKNLKDWISIHHSNVRILSTLVGDPNKSSFEKMQHYVKLIKAVTPEFKGMGVFNDRAISVSYSPLEQDGKSNLGVDMSARLNVDFIRKNKTPYITDILMSRMGNASPVAIFLAPVIISGEYKGYCSGVLEINRVYGVLANLEERGTHITLVDGQNRVIASTWPDFRMMDLFTRPYIGTWGDTHSKTLLWKPDPKPDISIMQQWVGSFLFNEMPVSNESHWRVIVEASLLPVVKDTSQYCLTWLAFQSLLIFAAILISYLLSNGFITSVKKLQVLTRSVPQKLHDATRIEWPTSTVQELSELSDNFREMTLSLETHLSDQKNAEERLRESREKLRLIADNLPDTAVYQYTRNENGPQFLFFSSGVEKIFPGIKAHDILNDATVLLNLIEPDQVLSFQKAVETSARLLTDFSMDIQQRVISGESRWFHVHSKPRRNNEGQIVWDGVIIDISERKRAEARIQLLADQRQFALDAAKLGWWSYDPVTRIATWDERYRTIFGVQEHKMPNDEILQKVIHPDDLPSLWHQVEAALDPLSPIPYAVQYRIVRPDGRLRWIEAHGIAIFEGEGENRHAVSFTGTVADITDRREAEKALLESEKKNRYLADIIRMGSQPVAAGYPDGKIGLMNKAFEDLTGYSFDELQSIDWTTNLTPPEWLPMERAMLEELHKTGRPVRYEKEYIRKDGTRVPVELFVHLATDPDGEREYFYAYITDITMRKRAEAQLQASERRNRQILHATIDGFFRIDRQGRILEVNQAYSRMSGYDIQELRLMTIADLDASMSIHDIESQMLGVIDSGKARFESRNRRKDGSVYDVEVSIQAREENGNIEFVAFLRDITQRKTMEKIQAAKLKLIDFALKNSTREFLQALLDEAEALTGSEIGFFHFVEADQETLSLQTWSTNTLKNMCTAEASDSHYPINKAGVWVDCVKEQKPVIHNDYANLPHKKGMPAGHAPVVREMVIPVLRTGKIVAILGVGNKKTDYHTNDVDTVRLFADLAWETVISKRAEEEKEESEEKYRTMMDSMNDGAYICSPDFRIEYLNPAMIRQIGRSALGEICHEVIHGLDHRCPWCTFTAIRRGERTQVEIECPRDGRIYDVSNSPIFHSDGVVSKMSIYRDISQIRHAELQLRQAQKLEAIGTLAAGIAHDFNNILFPITGLSELLLEDLSEESPERENVVEILKSARRAADLVNQILSFSRQGEKKWVPIRIQPILKEVYKLMRSSIPSNIALHHSIQKDCPSVMADPTQLHQIAMNLLTNAFHAVEEDGGEIVLTLRETLVADDEQAESALTPGKYAVISVSDTGEGINPAELDKIFEPYFTTKKEGKGTGLGLSVVYGIVKDHNGDILVLNEPGKGVRFDVYLPVLENIKADDPAAEREEDLPTGKERILLVDDEMAIVKLEENMLGRLGYQVTVFTDSIKARDAFTINPNGYDLVVSDMAMPNKTGAQLAHELRSIRPDLPIIICTGFSEKLDEEKAKNIGVEGFLLKPVKSSDLARMVRKVLDESIHTNFQ